MADGALYVWDLGTGTDAFPPQHAGRPLYGVAFSPDGSRLGANGWDETVSVWSVSGPE